MRPTDPRLRAQLTVATRPLLVVLGGGVVGSLLVVAQAFAVAALVVAVVSHRSLAEPAALVGSVLLGRAVIQTLTELAANRAATAVTSDLRRRIVRATVDGRTASIPEGELTVLATRGVAAAEPYLTRYLPAIMLAGVLPALTVVAIATQDLLSAVIVLTTLPLVPVFGILVGLATRDRAETQWRAMASLSGHFVDVMRGLPTLVAYRRARAQTTTIRANTERYRRATVATLRIAFATSAVLELVATQSVALVAVTVG
ncbi:MAG: ABC transporter transmembrane domain-containing protein, partial [Marmoricola sp.]